MKTNIYKVTIFKNKRLHDWFRFIGRVPTKEEVIEAIKLRLGGSTLFDYVNTAHFSEEIVSKAGIPTEIGPTSPGATWICMDIEMGKVHVAREDGWMLE